METHGSGPGTVWPRRALAVVEFAIAGLLLLFGVVGLLTWGSRVGGDGILTGIADAMSVPSLLSGLGLAVAAYTAWRGGRRWWAWQAALPAWCVASIVVLIWSIRSSG